MTSTDINHDDPLHRLAYLAALWGGDVRLRYLANPDEYEVQVCIPGFFAPQDRTFRAATVRDAYALALDAMEALTAEEDARETAAEVAP